VTLAAIPLRDAAHDLRNVLTAPAPAGFAALTTGGLV